MPTSMAMADIHWSLHMLNSSKGMPVNVSDLTFLLTDVLLSGGGQTRESMRRQHELSSLVSSGMKNVGGHAFAIWDLTVADAYGSRRYGRWAN